MARINGKNILKKKFYNVYDREHHGHWMKCNLWLA